MFIVVIVALWLGYDENFEATPGGTPKSPRDLAHFGRHLVKEVEYRAVQSIDTDDLELCFCCVAGWLRLYD